MYTRVINPLSNYIIHMRKAQVDFSIFFCASWIARGSYDGRHSAEMALQGSRLGHGGTEGQFW